VKCVYGLSVPVRNFIAEHIAHVGPGGLPEGSYSIGVADDANQIVGGFCYHDWRKENGVCEISGASTDRHWLTRQVLFELFAFPFNKLGCQMVVMRHKPEDKALARMLGAYGFKTVRLPRMFGRDADGLISTLTVEDWRANGFHRNYEGGSDGRQGSRTH